MPGGLRVIGKMGTWCRGDLTPVEGIGAGTLNVCNYIMNKFVNHGV